MDVRFLYFDRPPSCGLERSRFKSGYGKTLDLLDRELSHMGAVDVIIQAGFSADSIRLDGWPRGKAIPMHPACSLQFRTGKETLTFRAILYDRFEDNLRAIALSLEALRVVDRYGVVEGQQYAGFKRLAPPAPTDFIMTYGDGNTRDVEAIYRAAARRLHPDHGGSHEAFVAMQQAYEIHRKVEDIR
jgi:hypothetical protein